jgi:ABC-type transport system involved in cytochrome bd biosynthesis fused ATPase/permease subunit
LRKRTTKEAKPKAAAKSSKAMTGEQVYALVLGSTGKSFYKALQKQQKEIDAIDIKNPSPQSVARAAKGLSGMLDTFVNCIMIQVLLANLEARVKAGGYAMSPAELVSAHAQIARAKAWMAANCRLQK